MPGRMLWKVTQGTGAVKENHRVHATHALIAAYGRLQVHRCEKPLHPLLPNEERVCTPPGGLDERDTV
jgi:hypothetical protein